MTDNQIPSDAERQRRLHLVHAAMGSEALDLLICAGDDGSRGDVRYLTAHSIWSDQAYVLLRQGDPPDLIVSSRSQAYWAAQQHAWVRDVRSHPRPIVEVLAAVKSLKKLPRRIGVSGLAQRMPAGDLAMLQDAFPAVAIIDATELLQRLRATKSAEELAFIRHASAIAASAYSLALEMAVPGVTETALIAVIEAECRRLGSIITLMLTSNRSYLREPRARILEPGDVQMISIEIAAESGYWAEFGNTLFVGQPTAQTLALHGACEAMFAKTSSAIRTGAKAATIATTLTQAVESGPWELGIWGGHGIGLDAVETPVLSAGDDTTVLENTVFAIHPHLIDPRTGTGVYIADMVLATNDGGQLLRDISL